MTHIVRDRETLVAALRERGLDYLAPSDARSERPLDDRTLLASLAAHPEARLRQALVSLFLLRPELAPLVPELRSELSGEAEWTLCASYTAAVYLQRMWSLRLSHYLGAVRELPDRFSEELGLPPPEEGHGKAGLHALAEQQRERSSCPANPLSEFEGSVDLLFEHLKLRRREHESAAKR